MSLQKQTVLRQGSDDTILMKAMHHLQSRAIVQYCMCQKYQPMSQRRSVFGALKTRLCYQIKFYATCGEQGRECKWCHRPLPERFYSIRADVCDRCITRRQNWTTRQQEGSGKVHALEETEQNESLEPNTGNLWDIFFFVDNKEKIETILTNRLLNIKGMKWFMTLYVKFVKYNQNNEAIYAEPTFRSLSLACTNVSQRKEQMAEAFQHLHNSY